ncbi:MAG: serine/threonine protein phosphatase [Geminicoccaceae bacterium]|nr:serine/threonine protein phosphatase [Geminicoccaceae bacterium]
MSPGSHKRTKALLKRLFSRPGAPPVVEKPLVGGGAPRLPLGLRLYVVGDVHGRIDLLRGIETLIAEDGAASGGDLARTIVYLGDYVDRGFESRQVLDHLIGRPVPGFERVLLLGNHDLWLKAFVEGEDSGQSWLRFGGDATLLSYGVKMNFDLPDKERIEDARGQLRARMPEAHRAFLGRLELGFGLGDYFFCHAGVRPGVALDRQADSDLLWIREPFLSSTADHGKVVVHGHTIENAPVVRRNRLGIDTGACFTGNLTCLVIEGEGFRFLSTLRGGSGAPAG